MGTLSSGLSDVAERERVAQVLAVVVPEHPALNPEPPTLNPT